MAFENVNVVSLRNALNNCEDRINYSRSKELINNISNPNVWQSDLQPILKEALEKLINVRYKDLESKLEDYKLACNYIEEYQELAMQNQNLLASNKSLQRDLYNDENEKNTYVERKINNNKSQINSNENRMEVLERQVNELV